MKGMTTILIRKEMEIREILDVIPEGKVAKFMVASTPSHVDDSKAGSYVYLDNRGKVRDFMTDKVIKGLGPDNLCFINYSEL